MPNATPSPLLGQLAANTPPQEPSWWPLAIGYWLIIAAVILVGALIIYGYRQHVKNRPITNELARLKQQPASHEQLRALHTLLRWLLIHRCGLDKDTSSEALAHHIQRTLKGDLPCWVNAHYQPNPVEIDWRSATVLVKQWQRGRLK